MGTRDWFYLMFSEGMNPEFWYGFADWIEERGDALTDYTIAWNAAKAREIFRNIGDHLANKTALPFKPQTRVRVGQARGFILTEKMRLVLGQTEFIHGAPDALVVTMIPSKYYTMRLHEND